MVNTKNPFKRLVNFRGSDKGVTRPATRTLLVIIMLVAALGLAIGAAVIGSKKGEATYEETTCVCPDPVRRKCACPSKIEKWWKGFSIAVIALGIPMLVIFFIFFGCKIDKSTPSASGAFLGP